MSLWNKWATYVYSLYPEIHMVHWEAKLNLRSIIIYVGQINPYLDAITEDLNTAYLSIKSLPGSFKRKSFSCFCQSDKHFPLKMWKFS